MSKNKMVIPIFPCESAVPIPKEMMPFEDIKEYKFFTAFPCGGDDNVWMPYCSKDGESWVLCVGASVDGERIDVCKAAKKIQQAAEAIEGTRKLFARVRPRPMQKEELKLMVKDGGENE